MDEKERIEHAKFQQRVLDDLKYIKQQVKATNGRVIKLEEIVAIHESDISKAMIQISRNSGAIAKSIKDTENSKDELIKQYEMNDRNYKERRFWILVVIVLTIAGTVGVINSELVKNLIHIII